MCACLYSSYSLRSMWCVHFPLPDMCNPASSSLGTVSPRSPQRRMMMQRCCRSIAQLHRRHRTTLLYCICILSHDTLKSQRQNHPRWKKKNKSISRGMLICLNCQTFTMESNKVKLLRNYPVCMFVCAGSWIYEFACDISHLSELQGSHKKCWHPGLNLGDESTHPQVCRSTLLCHFQDTHTPACSQQCHEASAKCPRFYKTSHLHGNGL